MAPGRHRQVPSSLHMEESELTTEQEQAATGRVWGREREKSCCLAGGYIQDNYNGTSNKDTLKVNRLLNYEGRGLKKCVLQAKI